MLRQARATAGRAAPKTRMMLGNTPFLASHHTGDTAWLDLLFVPRDSRHQGWGRRLFSNWLRSLPEEIKKIEVLAVDLDGGSPIGFWRKLGFEVEDAYFEEVPETGCYMSRPARTETESPRTPAAAD